MQTRSSFPTPRASVAATRMDPATGVRDFPLRPDGLVKRRTPAKDLFTLAHLGIPRLDAAAWMLSVSGLVERTVSLALKDLMARPKRVLEAVHQCCGSPLEPNKPTRRVANVRWGGIDLASLLDEIGVDPSARFLWSFGADHGSFMGRPSGYYVKDLPLERLSAGDVLLAWELNDAPLSPEHGYPLRLVVPGFYGTNSVKWLMHLHLAAERADSLFTTELYNDPADGEGPPLPVWAIAPEAVIVAPATHTKVLLGVPVEIWGWAWAECGIARVEVSTDGGCIWQVATLEPRSGRTWQRYRYVWRPEAAGRNEILARAYDQAGTAQPDDGARNAVHRVTVDCNRQQPSATVARRMAKPN